MEEAAIYEKVTEVFRDVFADDSLQLTPNTSARDIEEWDSMKMVSIVLAIEEEFDIVTRTHEIDALQTVGDFVALIQRKTERS